MPEATLVGQLPQIILRGAGVAFAGGGTLTGPGPRAVSEFARLTAVFVMTTGTAPASGFPRIVQSVDGSSTDIITTLTLDTSQSHAVVYTADISLLLPYVFVQFTNGGSATTVDYLIQGWPSGASASSSSGSSGSGGVAPTGSVLSYGGSSAPSGWLLCDGTVYNITTYSALAAILGTTFGGDGITTFGVPDLRGRSPLGMGQGSGLTNRVLGASGGEETHVLSTAELAAHNHGVTDPGHTHQAREITSTPGIQVAYNGAAIDTNGLATTSQDGPNTTNTTGITIASAGSDTGHNTMHPFLVLNAIIKT